MKFDNSRWPTEEYTLSSGRCFSANCGIIGISPGVGSGISGGYDQGIIEDFTQEERNEIADFMIDLWTNWAKTGEMDDL